MTLQVRAKLKYQRRTKYQTRTKQGINKDQKNPEKDPKKTKNLLNPLVYFDGSLRVGG